MDEALKAVEVCSEEGLQKFLPYEMWIYYMCLEKSTFNRLVLRGYIERVFEVSSGGHRGRDIPQCTCMDSIFTLLLWGNTFHW